MNYNQSKKSRARETLHSYFGWDKEAGRQFQSYPRVYKQSVYKDWDVLNSNLCPTEGVSCSLSTPPGGVIRPGGQRQVRSCHTGAFLPPLLSQAFLQSWSYGREEALTHPAAICRWVLNGHLRLYWLYFRGSGNFPGREETRGAGSCFSGWDLKRSLLEKQMQKAPLSKDSRRPKGSVLKSRWEVFLNPKRQHNIQHNCVGYQLKKHLEPASCWNLDTKIPEDSCMFFTSTIYFLQRFHILSMPQ